MGRTNSISLLLSFILLLTWSFSIGQANSNNLLGGKLVWKNQLNSILTIEKIDPVSFEITGTYESPSGTSGQKFPVIGFVNTSGKSGPDKVTVVSFTVRWGAIGSITSWNGVYRPNERKIYAQWFLSRPVTQFKWDHILTGQDTFTPQ